MTENEISEVKGAGLSEQINKWLLICNTWFECYVIENAMMVIFHLAHPSLSYSLIAVENSHNFFNSPTFN